MFVRFMDGVILGYGIFKNNKSLGDVTRIFCTIYSVSI